MDKLTEKILTLGVKNCFFHGPLFDDEVTESLLLEICESRYPVRNNYKITLRALSSSGRDVFEHFYIMDLQKLIEEGHFIFLVKDSTFNK